MLIVDGYNVMRSGERYATLAEEDIDVARARLVADVAAYVQGEQEALVVFDGAGNPHSDGRPHNVIGVEVVFSRFGTDADSVVEQAVSMHRSAGHEVTVVTSDAQTQWAVMGGGVARMSSTGFLAELAGDEAELAQSNPSGSASSTVSERVDPEVSDVLARWARGLR